MDWQESVNFIRDNSWHELSVETIHGADHQLTFQNPEDVSDMIVQFSKVREVEEIAN